MNLKRTTIIPLDDPSLANEIFESFIESEMMILMIIIGDTNSIRTAIPRADNLAKLTIHNMERWVLWVRDYSVLEDKLKNYLNASDAENSDADIDDIKCISFSPIQDQVVGIILKNGRLSYASLEKLFIQAQKHDLQ